MHLLTLIFALAGLGLFSAACATPFDSLRSKVEDLGETLYVIGSWMDPWLNIVPKETYPDGAGYVRSAFTIERSEPGLDEEPWNYIQPLSTVGSISGTTYGGLDAAGDFQNVQVGHKEVTYRPERLPLVGPLVGQDDLVMYWHSKDFWTKYFKQMEMRSVRSISNRLANIYMRFIPKYSCGAGGGLPRFNGTTDPGSSAASGPDMSSLSAQLPGSDITQEFLDTGAVELIQEGAYDPNTQGWLALGPDGPIFPLLIGIEASQRIFQNNSEFRSDLNQSFQGWGEMNPVIKRMGSSRVIKNFRHVVTPFPPRWAYNAGAQKAIGTVVLATDSAGATTQLNTAIIPANSLYRIPVWSMSTNALDVTKGSGAIVNPKWIDPTVAAYEACISLHPWVMTEEVLKPLTSAPGMKWSPQNYFGEWDFVTGNDALLGFDTCTGIADPTHKLGRHFAYYRHALKPIFPQFARMWLFLRCSNQYETLACS